jgi:N-acetylneuraminate synthase/N,N'-diacetyllegionaminate synthase
MSTITVENRMIGIGQPVFIIAEIGYNFNTLDEGKSSIAAAVECGADAVKFQTFRAETIVSRGVDFPPEAGSSSQFDEFKQYEMSLETHRELFDYARQQGVLCFSTPSYYDDVELLEQLDVPLHKIGSDDLTNLPFIAFVARKGKPVIMSTGMGDLDEVSAAVRAFLSTGNSNLVLMHCVSNYPLQDLAMMNLRAIKTLANAFQLPVGFSDHSTSLVVPAAAVALGAVAVERHFTLSKDLPAPDCRFSADPAEFAAIVKGIREVESALGNGLKVPTASEVQMRKDARKSVIARCDIPAGTTISREMLIIKRPNWGIPPMEVELVVGRVARQNIRADEPVTWEHV